MHIADDCVSIGIDCKMGQYNAFGFPCCPRAVYDYRLGPTVIGTKFII